MVEENAMVSAEEHHLRCQISVDVLYFFFENNEFEVIRNEKIDSKIWNKSNKK